MSENNIKSEYEDEIELIDILYMIWRWRFFIAGLTGIILIVTSVFLFFSKNIYSVSMTIEPMVWEKNANGTSRYVEDAKNLKLLVDLDVVKTKIVDEMEDESLLAGSLVFKTNIIEPINQLVVSYESSNTDRAKEILKKLTTILNEKYKPQNNIFIDVQKKKLIENERHFELIDTSLISLKRQKEGIEKEYKVMLDEQKDLIPRLSGDVQNILIVYSRMSTLESSLDRYESRLYNLEAEKQKNIEEKEEIQNILKNSIAAQANNEIIRIAIPPKVSTLPVKPNKKLVLFLALVSGLLFSLLSAFFMEYLANHKKREH